MSPVFSMEKPSAPEPLQLPSAVTTIQAPYNDAMKTTMAHGNSTCDLMSTLSSFGDALMKTSADIAESTVASIYGSVAKITGYIMSALSPVTDYFKACSAQIQEWYKAALEKFNNGDEGGTSYFQNKISALKDQFSQVMNNISDALSPITDTLVAFGGEIKDALAPIGTALMDLKSWMLDVVSTITNSVCNVMSSAIENITPGTSSEIDAVKDFKSNGNKLPASDQPGSVSNSIVNSMSNLANSANMSKNIIDSKESSAIESSNLLKGAIGTVSIPGV